MASIVVLILLTYLLIGGVFYIPFILKGIRVIDHGAEGASLSFRLLILPGVVALWPVLLSKWLKKGKA